MFPAALSTISCSSGFRKDKRSPAIIAILPVSTSSRNPSIRLASRIYLCTVRPLSPAFSHGICRMFVSFASLVSQRLIFHLVGSGFLAGQKVLPLDIGIHHKHRGSVIVQIPDNHRHFCLSCQLAGPPSPVSSHHFISISA